LRLVAGADEAGRGAVIGPMVVAAVLFREEDLPNLVSMGVRDSKKLTPAGRVRVLERVMRLVVRTSVLELHPARIDRAVGVSERLRGLNLLEAEGFAKVLKELRPDVAYVDSPDPDAERFGRLVMSKLPPGIAVFSENKADERIPVVAAASILAKVRRDGAIRVLRGMYGDFGSGYPSDPRTVRFLRDWVRKRGGLPRIARRSWSTSRRMLSDV